MDKISKRVSKRNLILPTLAIVLSIFATGCSNQREQAEEVKSFDTYSFPYIEMKLHQFKLDQEQEAWEKYLNEIKEKAEADAQAIKKKLELEKERMAKLKAAEAKVRKEARVETASYSSKWDTYTLTHYTAKCKGCSGRTRTEIDVRRTTEYHGYKVLSVDPRKIPLGSIVEIKDGSRTYKAIAIDTGGAIKGNKLDLLVGSYKEAIKLGKKKIQLRIVRKGWQDEKKKI